MIKNIFCISLILPSLLFGSFQESSWMDEILPHVDESTWVVFDIDNTLIESSLHLGSAQWRDYIRQKARDSGYTEMESEGIVDRFWNLVQPLIPVKLVDPKTIDILQMLKDSHVPAIALTARETIEIKHTERQLHSVAIDLSQNGLSPSIQLSLSSPCSYVNGIIYSGENKKSDALIAFINQTGHRPKKVIFIDDKKQQIQDVESACQQLGIAFVGLRFGGSDERVKCFDGHVADLQWNELPRIIGDDQAKEALTTTKNLKY